jgi:hypothetical protein
MTERTVRGGGVAGIVFVVLIMVTAFSAGEPPAADDAVDKMREYFVDHRSALLASNLIGLVAVPFVFWFAVVLRELLRGDSTTDALGVASLAGLVLTASMALAGGAVATSVVYVDGVADKLDGDTLRIVYEAQGLLFAATSAGIVLFSLTAALAIRRTAALPAYTMWLALLATLGNLLTMVSTAGAGASMLGFTGLLTFALFVLVTGITMALGKATPIAGAANATD